MLLWNGLYLIGTGFLKLLTHQIFHSFMDVSKYPQHKIFGVLAKLGLLDGAFLNPGIYV